MADISDKVKELMHDYKEIKKNLDREYKEMEELNNEHQKKNPNKVDFKSLAKPIETRQKQKKTIKEELDEFKTNFPT